MISREISHYSLLYALFGLCLDFGLIGNQMYLFSKISAQ